MIRANETMFKAGQMEKVILRKLSEADREGRRHCIRMLSSFEYRNHLCLVFESLVSESGWCPGDACVRAWVCVWWWWGRGWGLGSAEGSVGWLLQAGWGEAGRGALGWAGLGDVGGACHGCCAALCFGLHAPS